MSHASPFARRATALALVFELCAIAGSGGRSGSRRRRGGGIGRSGDWTTTAHFQGAWEQQRQPAACRPLKNCDGVLRLARSVEFHVRSIGNRSGRDVFKMAQQPVMLSTLALPLPSSLTAAHWLDRERLHRGTTAS